MTEWRVYARRGLIEAIDAVEFLRANPSVKVSIADEDSRNGSPKEGDMIARNPTNNYDMWLINKDYFAKHYGSN